MRLYSRLSERVSAVYLPLLALVSGIVLLAASLRYYPIAGTYFGFAMILAGTHARKSIVEGAGHALFVACLYIVVHEHVLAVAALAFFVVSLMMLKIKRPPSAQH